MQRWIQSSQYLTGEIVFIKMAVILVGEDEFHFAYLVSSVIYQKCKLEIFMQLIYGITCMMLCLDPFHAKQYF